MSPIALNDVESSITTSLSNGNLLKPSLVKPWSKVPISSIVQGIRNPIREAMKSFDFSSNDSSSASTQPTIKVKKLLNTALGDPSVFGNMPPPIEAIDAIEKSLRSGGADGYPESIGYAVAREAVARYFSEDKVGGWNIDKEDVVMCHGASGALDMAIAVLADSTKNVLLPKPLFTAYETMISTTGASARYYNLLPEQNWEVDLIHLDSLIDENTAFIMICNPSNPTGTNWSKAHLKDIAALASRRRIVVLADEVYAGMAWNVTGPQPEPVERVQGKFNRGLFTPYASVAGNSPVIVLGAVSKRFLAPGWRTGWLIIHDPLNVMEDVRDGCARWAFRIQGPVSTVQRALPDMFASTPEKFFVDTLSKLEDVSGKLFARLNKIPGLKPLLPQGAMYLVCGGLTPENFPTFANDREFTAALLKEEQVLILPGECFRLQGYMRFVTTVPIEILLEACDRIEEFCARHAKK